MNTKTSAFRHHFPLAFAAPMRVLGPAIFVAAALTACGSSPSSTGSGTTDAFGSSMSFVSRRPASAIASCLASRIGSADRRTDGAATQLAVGGNTHHYAWLITLAPAATGTLVNVRKGSNDGPVPEPNMRYYIARCTT